MMVVAAGVDEQSPIAELSQAEADAIAQIAEKLCAGSEGLVDNHDFVASAREMWEEMPPRLRRLVREFRRHSGPHGALVVRGLPVQEQSLPCTPGVSGSVQSTVSVPAAVLLLMAHGLGDPAAFREEKSGALVQDVVPVPGQEEMQGNPGSVRLSFHIESAFHAHRPDYVTLLCLRTDHEQVAGLRTACVRQVLAELGDDSRQALFREEFQTAPPSSFALDSDQVPIHAVLSGASDDPDLRVDFASTTPLTEAGSSALTELSCLFDGAANTFYLAPGDFAIVDNRVTVHGRTAFRPRYDGQDRWLQRTFVLSDLRRSRHGRLRDGYVLNSR
jgi:L-asparagine oxygenase